jgi:carboxymethylenebutenolidase
MSGTCVRLKLGYFATAPELFAREGDVNTMTDLQTILDTVTAKILGSQVATDIDSAIARAGATKKADVERLGITGLCWGGRQVALRGGQSRRQGGGRLVWRAARWTPADAGNSAIRQWDREYCPKDPIDLVADLSVPVLGLYGGADPGIPVASVERMRETLKVAGKTAEIIVYPETPHAFHSDYRPSYREGRRRMAGSACSSGSSAAASPEPGHLS